MKVCEEVTMYISIKHVHTSMWYIHRTEHRLFIKIEKQVYSLNTLASITEINVIMVDKLQSGMSSDEISFIKKPFTLDIFL